MSTESSPSIYEHILCPGTAVFDPAATVTIADRFNYGFFLLPKAVVEDGILFRACDRLSLSCVDPELSRVQVTIVFSDGRRPLRAQYNPDEIAFEILPYENKKNQTDQHSTTQES